MSIEMQEERQNMEQEEAPAVCADCGAEIAEDDVIDVGGDDYCPDCAGTCEECGNSFINDDLHYTGNEMVCDDCGFRCDDCGEWELESNRGGDSHMALCQSCAEHYYCCNDCDSLYHEENGGYCEECDRSLCDSCLSAHDHEEEEEESRDLIHDYSYKPRPNFYGTGGPYLGVELEIEANGSSSRDTIADELSENEKIYLKHDGSLGTYGVEIVSHPATLAYHLENLGWKSIFKTCTNVGATSHDPGTCGLHVHINKTFFEPDYELNCLKIIYFFDRHWDHLVKFSRRNGSLSYCQKPDNTETNEHAAVREHEGKGRYYAVNLCPTNTIEIRLWRGTLRLDTFLATLQFTELLARWIKNVSVQELQRSSWAECLRGILTVKYAELVEYLNKRGLINATLNSQLSLLEDNAEVPPLDMNLEPITEGEEI